MSCSKIPILTQDVTESIIYMFFFQKINPHNIHNQSMKTNIKKSINNINITNLYDSKCKSPICCFIFFTHMNLSHLAMQCHCIDMKLYRWILWWTPPSPWSLRVLDLLGLVGGVVERVVKFSILNLKYRSKLM